MSAAIYNVLFQRFISGNTSALPQRSEIGKQITSCKSLEHLYMPHQKHCKITVAISIDVVKTMKTTRKNTENFGNTHYSCLLIQEEVFGWALLFMCVQLYL